MNFASAPTVPRWNINQIATLSNRSQDQEATPRLQGTHLAICLAINTDGAKIRRRSQELGRELSAPPETTPKKLLLQNAVQASVSESLASCNNKENKELPVFGSSRAEAKTNTNASKSPAAQSCSSDIPAMERRTMANNLLQPAARRENTIIYWQSVQFTTIIWNNT